MPDDTEAPSGSCVLCWHRDPYWPPACDLCRARLPRRLWELRDKHALLTAALRLGQSGGLKVSGTKPHSLPLAVQALDLAGPASRDVEGVTDTQHQQDGTWSVAAVLDSWVRDWNTYLDVVLPAPEVEVLVPWLAANMRWALDYHPAIVEFADEVTRLLYACRAVLNLSETPIHMAEPCPSCDRTALRRDPGGGEVECRHCRTVWETNSSGRLVPFERRAA